jgi:SSS family solute:Na+ symporter
VLSIFYTLLGVSLFVPVVAGLYLRRVGTPEAAAAIVGGIAALVAVQTATGGVGWSGLTPAMIGLAAAILAAVVVLVLRRQPAPVL